MSIPRADIEAFVTTEETISDERAELFRNRSRMFDGEIGEATPCIQNVGLGKSLSGAGIDAAGACSAVVLAWGRGGDDEVGEDRTEHEPGPVLGMDEKGVFPLPTETGHGGERLFH